jgi:hypothetical protein
VHHPLSLSALILEADRRSTQRRTAADTDGELLSFELVLAPGGAVPGAPRVVAGPGETVVVPAGRVHRFENAPLAVRVALAPLAWVAERRGRELQPAELTPSSA